MIEFPRVVHSVSRFMYHLYCFGILSLLPLAYAQATSVVPLAPPDSTAIQVNYPSPDYGSAVASLQLLTHEFANSYFEPAPSALYTPPNVQFNHVELTLNANVSAIQYDRLSHIFIGDVEVWRPSTAETDNGHLKTWNFTKDVSEYLPLFQKSSNVTIILGNIVETEIPGVIQYELIANFFYKQEVADEVANYIVPINPQSSGATTYAITSNWTFTLDKFAKNTTKAVLNVRGSGNSEEEFWYTNIFDENLKILGDDNYGAGPSRIITVYINGDQAGFAYPYPIIYTGGISPILWRTVVGIDAFEVPSYKIDITPFLPDLWSGSAEIVITITNGYSDEAVNSDWLFTANVQTWQESGVEGSGIRNPSTGSTAVIEKETTEAYGFVYQVIDIYSRIDVSAQLQFIRDNRSEEVNVEWQQNGSFTNYQQTSTNESVQNIFQACYGQDKMIRDGEKVYSLDYNYPLQIVDSETSQGSSGLTIKRGLQQVTSDFQVSTIQFSNLTESLLNGTTKALAYTDTSLSYNGPQFFYSQHALADGMSLVTNSSSYSSKGWQKRALLEDSVLDTGIFQQTNVSAIQTLEQNLQELSNNLQKQNIYTAPTVDSSVVWGQGWSPWKARHGSR